MCLHLFNNIYLYINLSIDQSVLAHPNICHLLILLMSISMYHLSFMYSSLLTEIYLHTVYLSNLDIICDIFIL